MRQRVLGALLPAALLVMAAGCATPDRGAGGATVQPSRRPGPASVEAICSQSAEALRQLDRRLHSAVTAENLAEQATTLATITGVIAADLERLRVALRLADEALASRWVSELEVAVDAGVAAVHAGARRDSVAYAAGAREMADHRSRARATAADVGYPMCRY